jgi:hypothetical protein
VHGKPRASPAIATLFFFVRRFPLVCTQGIKAFEDESAVIAQEFMQSEHADEKHRIIIVALDPLALTPRALHAVHSSRLRTPTGRLPQRGTKGTKFSAAIVLLCGWNSLREPTGRQWYTDCAMRADLEDYLLNPPPGSAAARAVEFGIDLTLTVENLRLTPEQRVRKLDDFIEGVAKLRASLRIIGPANASTHQHH